MIPTRGAALIGARIDRRWWVGVFAASLLLLAPLRAAPGSPRVHATLVASEPAADAHLTDPPRRVWLQFSEPIEASLARVVLIDGEGHATPLAAGADPRDVHALVAPVTLLAPGAYRVSWRIVSADGHPVQGSFVFHVGPARDARAMEAIPPLPPEHVTSEPAALRVSIAGAPVVAAALRGIAIGCLAALGGILLLGVLLRAEPSARPLRVARWLAVAAPLLLAAHALVWVMHVSPAWRLGTRETWAALGTAVGRVEITRIAFAVLTLWALVLARRRVLALLLALAALLASGAAGHSMAIVPMWSVPFKALHLTGAALWLGGLLWLVMRDHTDASRFRTEAGRVSSLALTTLIAVAASGLGQTILMLHSPADLVRSAYGAVVLGKVAGLTGLAALGAFHRFRLLPRLGEAGLPATLRSSVAREVALMGFVVLLGALLAYIPPPSAAESSPHTHGVPR